MTKTEMLNKLIAVLSSAETLDDTPTAKSGSITHTVCRRLRAYKPSKGLHKDKWMLSAGDIKVDWRSSLVPASALAWDKNHEYRETATDWELTYTCDRLGYMRGVSARDTGVVYQSESLDEDNETLDDPAETKHEDTAETKHEDTEEGTL